jgi:hypothetical protein
LIDIVILVTQPQVHDQHLGIVKIVSDNGNFILGSFRTHDQSGDAILLIKGDGRTAVEKGVSFKIKIQMNRFVLLSF